MTNISDQILKKYICNTVREDFTHVKHVYESNWSTLHIDVIVLVSFVYFLINWFVEGNETVKYLPLFRILLDNK